MDGMGSPEGMMEHSMMDLKGSMGSPYSCYSSPKLPYDSFSNRGELVLFVKFRLSGFASSEVWWPGHPQKSSPINFLQVGWTWTLWRRSLYGRTWTSTPATTRATANPRTTTASPPHPYNLEPSYEPAQIHSEINLGFLWSDNWQFEIMRWFGEVGEQSNDIVQWRKAFASGHLL